MVRAGEWPERFPSGFWLALAAGLALRLWYLSDLVGQPWFGYPLVDALTFDRTALGILRGDVQGVFTRPPLYPHFLAALYRVAGHSAAAVAVAQFLLGLAVLAPAYRLGERWFGPRAAQGGVWIAAVYPLRIFFEGEALDVTLFTFLFVWATWTLWQALERATVPRVLVAGVLYGAAALARPNALLALPLVGVGLALAFRVGWRRLPALAGAGALGVALGLLPAATHNWLAERVLVPVAANGGVNFYLGNARGATGRTPVAPGLHWQEVVLRPIRAGETTPAAQDRWWYRQAAGEIRAAPGRWLSLLGVKAALFFNAAESSNNKALAHFTGISPPVRHFHGWFGAVLCLALLGLLARPGPGALFLACLTAGFAASVVLFFVAERYRLPLVPLLAPAAAAGAGELWRALRLGERSRALRLAGLLCVAAAGVFPDWLHAGAERISPDHQMGQVFLMRGEPRRALASLERARAADPADPDVLNSLGAAHVALGDLDAAESAYRSALDRGEFGEVWFNLGVVAERRGPEQRAAAAERYRRAIAANPLDRRARANLAALEAGAGGAGGHAAPPR